MLTFEFSGVEGKMTVSEVLTSGMVGRQMQLLFDESWDALTKTVVFQAGEVCRTAEAAADTAVIPEAVLARPFRRLYVGVYGTDGEGTLVIPTVMAEGPMIRYGADPMADPGGEAVPVWKRIQAQIGDLSELETVDADSLVAAVNELDSRIDTFEADGGFSRNAAALLITILRSGVYVSDPSGNIDALEQEFAARMRTLTGISAVYSGGTVPVGYSLSALTGITVTASYSDGSEKTVTGYTLSGEILEGENIITVTYRDMTATIAVTGSATAESQATLTGIEAYYSGGSVAVGTPLSEIGYITVLAHYSDGTGHTVEDYTLSGEILEGENIITVTYGDATDTVTITGAATAGGSGSTGSETEPQSETLELVYASSYPNVTTFAYTEAAFAGQYSVAKQGTIPGGVLRVDYDPEVCNQWNLNLYVFDADGNPSCQTDKAYSGDNTYYNWGQNELSGWEAVGAGSGFGTVYAPFAVQLPENCTCIACIRMGNTATKDGTTVTSNSTFTQWAVGGGITFTVTAAS